MKKLLFLGGSRYLLPAIRHAKALGCHTITCDYLPENPAHRFSDETHNVSITDRDAVLALAERLGVDGLMSFACDPGVVTAAYVAEKLGLPSCGSFRAVSILQDKAQFRRFLAENGFTVPWFRACSEPAEALAGSASFPYPLIVKPVDSAGSKGVSRADSPAALPESIRRARAYSRSGGFILEEFIEPLGFASDSECFSVDGEFCFASFNCQYFDADAGNPYTPAGFSWPSALSPAAQTELRAELQRLIGLLGLGTSLYNAELREGPDGRRYIMELSPRGGGNRLCELLRHTCGVDLIQNAVKAALGEPVEPLSDPVYSGCWAEAVLHSRRAGRFAALEINPDVRPYIVEEDLWVRPGDPVEDFSGADKTIGTLILRFPSPAELHRRMTDMGSWLNIVLEE